LKKVEYINYRITLASVYDKHLTLKIKILIAPEGMTILWPFHSIFFYVQLKKKKTILFSNKIVIICLVRNLSLG